MAVCTITASVNAGAVFQFGSVRLYFDALPGGKTPDFSTLTPQRWERLLAHPAFSDPNLLVFTHCHDDHFSLDQTQAVLRRCPGAFCILPKAQFSRQLLLSAQRQRVVYGDVTLEFFRLPHEGAQYARVPHYGCLIEYASARILLPGDCALASPALKDFLAGRSVDLAVMNFPWITLGRGRRFLEEVIRPAHLLVWHLPLPEDDLGRFRPAAVAAAAQIPVPDVRLMLCAFQEERYLL